MSHISLQCNTKKKITNQDEIVNVLVRMYWKGNKENHHYYFVGSIVLVNGYRVWFMSMSLSWFTANVNVNSLCCCCYSLCCCCCHIKMTPLRKKKTLLESFSVLICQKDLLALLLHYHYEKWWPFRILKRSFYHER